MELFFIFNTRFSMNKTNDSLVEKKLKRSVCDKREHPEYKEEEYKEYNNTTARRDKDIVILKLCQPLMFSKGLPIPN